MSDDRVFRPSIEMSDVKMSEEDAAHTFLAREIVQEIRKFGVTQITLEKIIELLALELESRDKMLTVIGAVRGNIETSGSPIISE
jgi:hypothetical protein